MPLPVIGTPPAHVQLSKNQKKNALRKKRRERAVAAASVASPSVTSAKNSPQVCGSKGRPAADQTMEYESDDEELTIKLNALAKKTEELQGYINQLQDAVTIGMFQLRDLKKQIASATAARTTTGK